MIIINKYLLVWNDLTKEIIFSGLVDIVNISTGEEMKDFIDQEEMEKFINENALIGYETIE